MTKDDTHLIACGRPLPGQVFYVKNKIKAEFKRHLRVIRYNSAEFPKSAVQWKKVINPSKVDSLGTTYVIPDLSWLRLYKNVYCKIDYSVIIIILRAYILNFCYLEFCNVMLFLYQLKVVLILCLSLSLNPVISVMLFLYQLKVLIVSGS